MRLLSIALRRRTFRSLRRHRNYRLFFAGQVVSVAGTWMQNIALAWLVIELSSSPLAVGALAFCRFVPFFLFGLVAGVVIDRFDTRRLLLATQGAAMVVSIALAVVTLAGCGDAAGRLRPGGARRARARLRRAGTPDADVPDGRRVGAAERRRAQLRPLQRLSRDRPRARRAPDRGGRDRPVLRRQRDQLPGGARRALPDARGRAVPRREATRDAGRRRHPRGPRLGGAHAARANRAQRGDGRQPRRLQLPRARPAARLADARRRRGHVRPALGGLRSRRARRRARDGQPARGEPAGLRRRRGRLQPRHARARARPLGRRRARAAPAARHVVLASSPRAPTRSSSSPRRRTCAGA